MTPSLRLSSDSQVISLFTLVEVQLRVDGAAMKYGAALQRPEQSASYRRSTFN